MIGANGKAPFGPSKPSRVPWPPASSTAATRPSRQGLAPAAAAARSRSRSASRARQGDHVLAAQGLDPARARAAPSPPTRSPTRRPTRSRSSASTCSPRRARSAPDEPGQGVPPGGCWPACAQALLEAHAAGLQGHLHDPLGAVGHQAVALGGLGRAAGGGRASAPGRSRRARRGPGARGSSACPARARRSTEMLRRNWSNQLTLGVLPMKWSMPRHAIVPPGRTQAWAVAIDSGPEIESTTTWAPSPPVCSMTASVISSSSRESTTRVAPSAGRRLQAVGVVAQAHDPLGALGPRAVDAGQPDGAVADHDHGLSRRRAGRGQAVPAGGHDVDERQQRGLAARLGERLGRGVQRALGERDAHELGLAALHGAAVLPDARRPPEERPADAGGGQALAAPGAVRRRRPCTTTGPGRRAARPRTSGPTSSTVPMNSWPRRDPAGNPKASPALKTCRSEPQMPAIVTRTIASVGCSIAGSAHVLDADVARALERQPPHRLPLARPGARIAAPGPRRPGGRIRGMAEAPHAALADRFRADPGRAQVAIRVTTELEEGMRLRGDRARPHRAVRRAALRRRVGHRPEPGGAVPDAASRPARPSRTGSGRPSSASPWSGSRWRWSATSTCAASSASTASRGPATTASWCGSP